MTGYCDRFEITDQMIDAGEDAILRQIGGAEGLGGYFSARELAVLVFRAMALAKNGENAQPYPKSE